MVNAENHWLCKVLGQSPVNTVLDDALAQIYDKKHCIAMSLAVHL